MNNSNISTTSNVTVYFATIGLSALLLLGAIVTLNYVVDPYFIHQWDSPLLHRLSPAQQKIMPWAKTYAAYRYQPEVVFLGSSRTEIGLPTESHLFSGKRVFNLAISGASTGDAINMLRHTAFFHRPEIIVWGLDYGWQFREKTGNTDFEKELVAKGPYYSIRRAFLNIKRSVSMAMTGDALNIVFGKSEQSCQSLLTYYGHKSWQCLEIIMKNEGGTKKAFEEVLKKKEPLGNPEDVAATVQLLDRVIGDYCQDGTTLRFYFQPIHALAELSYWATLGADLDNWKRALVQMIDARRQGGCDVQLYDFSGFNSITTEEIPQTTGKDTMQHYWEQSHYRGEVGLRILEEMLGKEKRAEDNIFGIELRGDTIEQHLLNFRQSRQQYITEHPKETANIVQ
ncbi:MAG: hypothetical protein KJ630_20595 [Proteobacteria bacterium]|nr:hypothetical protein [Pseudomonadota bacterium]